MRLGCRFIIRSTRSWPLLMKAGCAVRGFRPPVFSHRQIRHVCAPHLIGPRDRQIAQQIGIDPMLGVQIAGTWALVNRDQSHFLHQAPHPTRLPPRSSCATVGELSADSSDTVFLDKVTASAWSEEQTGARRHDRKPVETIGITVTSSGRARASGRSLLQGGWLKGCRPRRRPAPATARHCLSHGH